MRGLDPRISIMRALLCLAKRDGRDKPGHDAGETVATASQFFLVFFNASFDQIGSSEPLPQAIGR
jgi:hypothetical protein